MISRDCTIIVPTYNRCNSLVSLVENVLNNTPGSCSLKIIDNGSSDDTWQTLVRLAQLNSDRLDAAKKPENDRFLSQFIAAQVQQARTQYVWFSHDLMELSSEVNLNHLPDHGPTIILKASSGLAHLYGKTISYADFAYDSALLGACSELGSAIIPTQIYARLHLGEDRFDPYAHLCCLIACVKLAGSVYIYPGGINGRSSGAIEALSTHWSISEKALTIAITEWIRCLSEFLDKKQIKKSYFAMADASRIFSLYRLLILRARGHLGLRQSISIGKQLLRRGKGVVFLKLMVVHCISRKMAFFILEIAERLLPAMQVSSRKIATLKLINIETKNEF